MAKTLIDIDEAVLAEAAELLGTTTKKDTVNTALEEVILRRRRLKAFDELAEMGRDGQFNDLLDKKKYRR